MALASKTPGLGLYPIHSLVISVLSVISLHFIIFSERELMFTFAICCRPSVCRLSVCNVRAPYSGGSNFP